MKSKWLSLLVPVSFGVWCATGCGGSALLDGNEKGSAGSGGEAVTDFSACSTNSDCELQSTSCCDCGTDPASDYIAINRKYEEQGSRRCAAVDCGCPPLLPDPNAASRYYVATCSAGHCVVVDLHTTDVTACQTASDCGLRGGTTCCAGCGTALPIAIASSKESELEHWVCDPAPLACGPCASPSSSWAADCNGGRCTVIAAPCTEQHPCPL